MSSKSTLSLRSLTILEHQTGLHLLALVLTVLICMLSVALPAIKSKLALRLFHTDKDSTLLLRDSEGSEG